MVKDEQAKLITELLFMSEQCESKFQEGDTIEWSFDNSDKYPEYLKGKTFQAKIIVIQDQCYGVYAEYGQDYIPFNKAKLISKK